MRFILFIFIIITSILPLKAGIQIADSLASVLGSNKPDTVKIDFLNKKSISLFMNQPARMLMYADSAIKLSIRINDSLRLANSYNRKGVAYHFLSNKNNALENFLKSLNIKENLGKYEMLIPEYNNIGMVLTSLGKDKESLQYYLMGLHICHQINDKENEAKIWNNIGSSYKNLKQYDEAQKAYERSIDLNKNFFEQEPYIISLNNLGNIYKETKNYEKSIEFYNKAINKIEKTNNLYLTGLLLNNLSDLYITYNRIDQAEETLTKAERIINIGSSVNLKITNLKLWSQYHEKISSFDTALDYRKKYELLSDSVGDNDRATIYDHLKTLAELEPKIKELDLLKTLNTIQKKQISDQRFIQIGTILFSILLLATLLLLIKYLRTKDKLNNSLQNLVEQKTVELKKARIQAEKSDRLKSAFLSNISHHVRTPMNAIVGFSNLVIKQEINETERNQFLSHINSNTLRLLKLFENVTQLSKFEQNDVTLKDEVFYPSKITNSLIVRMRENPLTFNYLKNIKNQIPDEIEITTDKEIFGMIMEELLDNAVKFSNSGEIVISANIKDSNFDLSIEDNGIGISKDHLSNVFDKFTKFESSLIPGYDGPGIGLSIVKRSVKHLNGQVNIKSKKDKGTTVTFSIPVYHQS